jgi:tetratricopeptide (TPR) repeat protein
MSDLTSLYNEADKLKDDGKYEEAIAKLQHVLAEDPDYVLAHLALGVLCGKVGRHAEAVEHGIRACELEPEEAFNFTAMSVTYQRAFAGTQNAEYIHRAEDAMAKAHALQHRQHLR